MKNIILYIIITIIPLTSWGLDSDKVKPANFIADYVTFNEKTGIKIFTGHVKMDQGTTHLTGDKVTVYNANGSVVKIVAIGNPAHYSTLPDNQKEVLNATAQTIEYYPQKSIAVLIDNGIVTQGENVFKGPHITYDMIKQTVISKPTDKQIQSTIVIQPQDMPGQKTDKNDAKATQNP